MPRQTTSEMTRVVRFANTAALGDVVQAVELMKDIVKTRRGISAERSEKIKAGRKAAKPRRKKKEIAMPVPAAPPSESKRRRRSNVQDEATGGALPPQGD